jgi:EAL domain-containing protein (putative c-di-GMP-specific phosphodiesterase class I)
MTGSKDNLEIVRTIIKLAQNLKMNVVAEGVETAAQVTALQEMGCEYGQGYFFAKSLPAEKAAELLAEHSVYNILQPDRVIEYENTLIA